MTTWIRMRRDKVNAEANGRTAARTVQPLVGNSGPEFEMIAMVRGRINDEAPQVPQVR